MSFMQRGLALATLFLCVFGVCALKKTCMQKHLYVCACLSVFLRACVYACAAAACICVCDCASPLSMPAVPLGPVLSVGVSSHA